ncbi:MAG TPA: outer membrane beta-barrel protein [Vicinamibacterales bacterium]|nr:outer membrane beta-barrel protein [Vicinamibacterales bacterium]
MTRRAWVIGVGLFALVVAPLPAAAQDGGLSIGPRLTFIRGAEGSADGSQRFSGGSIRLGGSKTALELAMDYRSGITGDLTERIKDYPIQASLLVFPIRARIAPYLLGGLGWYSQRIEPVAGAGPRLLAAETTRKMGYHGGLGAEVRLHRRVGLYGDYRYTKIRLGEGDDEGLLSQIPAVALPFLPGFIPLAQRLKLSHEGSMFAWGANFYF